MPKAKKFTQRATIILTDRPDNKFDIDLVFEPSIKGREQSAEVVNSRVVVAARETCAYILGKWSPPKILAPNEQPARQALEKPLIIVP